MTLSLAVIGTGYFSQFQCSAWQRLPEVRLAAVCSLDGEAAARFREHYGFEASFSDVEQMLAAVKPDLVDVVTPPASHLALITRLAAAGVDAICQKPFCRNLAEAEQAVRVAEAAGIRLIVHENFRFQPWYQQIKTLLDSKVLGRLYQAQFSLRPGDGRGEQAYLSRQPYFRDMPRLLIRETAVHFIDVFRFLFGEIVDVWASLRRLNPAIRGEDAGMVVMHTGDGLQLTFDGNRLSSHAADNCRRTMGEMLIEGELGCLHLDGDGRIRLRFHTERDWQEHDYLWQDRDFGGDCVWRTQHAALEGLLHRAGIVNPARDYLNNLKVEEAIYHSHEQKRQICL